MSIPAEPLADTDSRTDSAVTDVQTKSQRWPVLCHRSTAGTAAKRRKMRRQGKVSCCCFLGTTSDFYVQTKSLLKPVTANLHQSRRKSGGCAAFLLGTDLMEKDTQQSHTDMLQDRNLCVFASTNLRKSSRHILLLALNQHKLVDVSTGNHSSPCCFNLGSWNHGVL